MLLSVRLSEALWFLFLLSLLLPLQAVLSSMNVPLFSGHAVHWSSGGLTSTRRGGAGQAVDKKYTPGGRLCNIHKCPPRPVSPHAHPHRRATAKRRTTTTAARRRGTIGRRPPLPSSTVCHRTHPNFPPPSPPTPLQIQNTSWRGGGGAHTVAFFTNRHTTAQGDELSVAATPPGTADKATKEGTLTSTDRGPPAGVTAAAPDAGTEMIGTLTAF